MMSVDYLFDRMGVDAVGSTAAYSCDFTADGFVAGQDLVEPVFSALKEAKDPTDLVHGILFKVSDFYLAKLQG